MKQNFILALIFVVSIMAMFFIIITRGLGGKEALFAILGYLSGWLSSVVLFYFRKKPSEP